MVIKISETNIEIKQVKTYYKSCYNNAKRLISDAKILFDEKRYPSSMLLSINSIEELAKLSMVKGKTYGDKIHFDLKEYNKTIKSHFKKSEVASYKIITDWIMENFGHITTKEEFETKMKELEPQKTDLSLDIEFMFIQNMPLVKEMCLYVDVKNNNVISPLDFKEARGMAEEYLEIANKILNIIKKEMNY